MKKARFSKKFAVLALAGVMMIGGIGGGTLAWLTTNSGTVTNTFSPSDITVILDEVQNSREFKLVPGWVIDKTPYVYVTGEDCYLFIKVEAPSFTAGGEEYTVDQFIDYQIKTVDENNNPVWFALGASYPGIYYKAIDDDGEKGQDNKHYVLGAGTYNNETPNVATDDLRWGDNQVLTKPSVTKEMMEDIGQGTTPQLKFTAYAVQLWKQNEPDRSSYDNEDAYAVAVEAAQFSPEDAWKLANPQPSTPTT